MTIPSTLIARIRLWAGFFAKISYPRDLRLVLLAFANRRRLPIPDETWSFVEPIRGFLSAKEAGLLHWAASAWPVAGPVLELGSYEGRSTIVFARAGRQVHAVDAWSSAVDDLSAYGTGQNDIESTFKHFKENLDRAQVEGNVTVHRGLTHAVGRDWKVPGAILYVDAGHTYVDAKGDLQTWIPHLLPDGLLLMHDVLGDAFLDVTRVASELLQQNWHIVASGGSIVAFVRKRE